MIDKNSSSDPLEDDKEQFVAPWERAFDRITTPFEEFIHNQTSSGLILMGVTLLALVVANSPLVDAYKHLVHTPVAVSIGSWSLEKTLHHWINDGLMVLFFFLVGLEIKREMLVGELASARQAALPIFAAIGGMVVPALIYFLINPEGPGARGWGIPMATDIAFAVGALVLLGKRVPQSLLMFLVALAIVDDLGAVLVIAVFYTETISFEALGLAALMLAVLIVFNLGGIRKPLPYFLVGVVLWLAMLKSGIHATVAGVLVAWTIPARPKYDPLRFSRHMRSMLDRFDASYLPGASILRNPQQRSVVQTLENGIHMVETPLQRLEHSFHLPVGIFVIPIFALVNAGIPIDFGVLDEVAFNPVVLGVILGLVLGKFIGIAGVSWLVIKLGIARPPAGTDMRHIIGIGLLGGIGFTMSIFIAELAFAHTPQVLLMAKTGILFASLLAGILGYIWFLVRVKE
jgi:NhaA family Na+:H+ antiporter